MSCFPESIEKEPSFILSSSSRNSHKPFVSDITSLPSAPEYYSDLILLFLWSCPLQGYPLCYRSVRIHLPIGSHSFICQHQILDIMGNRCCWCYTQTLSSKYCESWLLVVDIWSLLQRIALGQESNLSGDVWGVMTPHLRTANEWLMERYKCPVPLNQSRTIMRCHSYSRALCRLRLKLGCSWTPFFLGSCPVLLSTSVQIFPRGSPSIKTLMK